MIQFLSLSLFRYLIVMLELVWIQVASMLKLLPDIDYNLGLDSQSNLNTTGFDCCPECFTFLKIIRKNAESTVNIFAWSWLSTWFTNLCGHRHFREILIRVLMNQLFSISVSHKSMITVTLLAHSKEYRSFKKAILKRTSRKLGALKINSPLTNKHPSARGSKSLLASVSDVDENG